MKIRPTWLASHSFERLAQRVCSVCLPRSEWSRDGGRMWKAAVLAGVGLPISHRLAWPQLGSGEIEILAFTSATGLPLLKFVLSIELHLTSSVTTFLSDQV